MQFYNQMLCTLLLNSTLFDTLNQNRVICKIKFTHSFFFNAFKKCQHFLRLSNTHGTYHTQGLMFEHVYLYREHDPRDQSDKQPTIV